MEESEHRALWGALGVALLISGVVVLSDWTFVVAASTSKKDLAVLWWPWVGALVLMAMGVYVLAAASKTSLWLPGRAELERRRKIRARAELLLGWFHNRGSRLSIQKAPNLKEYSEWFDALGDYVAEAWGLPESTVLRPPGPVIDVVDEVQKTTSQVSRLIERCRMLQVIDTFDPFSHDDLPKWRLYVDAQKHSVKGVGEE